MDSQLQRLSESIALPQKAVNDQLIVAFHLLKDVRPSFPRCVIVPFGSAISGLGTRTSDCDLAFYADPPASFVDVLSGSRYFPSPMLPLLKKLEDEYGVKFFPPHSSPLHQSPSKPADEIAVYNKTSGRSRTVPSSSSPRKEASKEGSLFNQVRKLIYRSKDLSDHRNIPKARCPIVKFVHNSTSLHCDICVDAYLSVLNTRLIKGYCDFDERVAVLIRLVKSWVREHGIGSNVINSYSLSLMVIFALQQCSPPVLPCLQSPGSWPRNLEWHKKQHLLLENDVDKELTRWDVHFCTPQSLMPSLNRHGTANLLLHFFDYYANVFDSYKHVVCVRSSKVTLKQQLTRKSLTVQDPFDLSHNVARSFKYGSLNLFKFECQQSASTIRSKELVRTPPNVISVKPPFSRSSVLFDIPFSPEQVSKFLQHDNCYQALSGRVTELDWTSLKVQFCLGQLFLTEIVRHITSRFGFICEGDNDPSISMEEWTGEQSIQNETMDLEVSSSGRKRGRSWNVQEFASSTEHIKRSRTEEFEPEALDLLYELLSKQTYPHSYTCNALPKTWVRLQEVSSSPSFCNEPTAESVLEGTAQVPTFGNVLQVRLHMVPSTVDKLMLRATAVQGKITVFNTFCDVLTNMKC